MMTPSDEKTCAFCACTSGHGDKKCDKGRREFLAYAGAIGAAGAACALLPLIDTEPDWGKAVQGAVEVDVSNLGKGESLTVSWGGKPVFIRRRTTREIEAARQGDLAELRDPQTDEERVRQSVVDGKEAPEWLVVVGVCPHLGCVPTAQNDGLGEFDGWLCPCHGAEFDGSARVRKGPASQNLAVPPYRFIDAKRIKIG